MRCRHLVFLCLVACGRFGFDAGHSDGGNRGDDGLEADGLEADDALSVCVTGDGICAVSCLGIDPDCNTTCGDGVCVGNAGEFCGNCAECNTRNVACGNGDCEATEDSDSCYADCGPTQWLWAAEEDSLRAMFNAMRTGGYQCPGASMPTTAPMLTRGVPFDAQAREWAWEMAHQRLPQASISCNGRTIDDRWTEAQAVGIGHTLNLVQSSITLGAAFGVFVNDMQFCNHIMSPGWTRLGIGIARDMRDGFVIFLN